MNRSPSDQEQLERVQVLAPRGGKALGAFLRETAAPGEPFSRDRMDALEAFSSSLLKDPRFRQSPASIALAFWMRRASLHKLRESFQARFQAQPEVLWVPVGRVFHVAPANVDTLFLYSWALSFLCGNANVVRLSRNLPPAVDALLELLDRTSLEHAVLAAENRFVTYEHDADLSGIFSAWCLHRIVWGGDATVKALREVPLNPHASERSFASKFSFSLVKTEAYLALDAQGRSRLASAFFNDVFWFDQAACSSPQVLFWVGEPEGARRASTLFLDAVQAEADRRGQAPDAAQACLRLNAAFDLALQTEVRVDLSRPALLTVEMTDIRDLTRDICGGGFLRTARVTDPMEILPFIGQQDQTLTHFGFTRAELLPLARSFGARGLDRIVPVGSALDFHPLWDGFNLVEDGLRRVVVQEGPTPPPLDGAPPLI